jgi:cation diffusion facilitator family transporter
VDHHYGHGRVSTLVALFIGGALLLAAGYILYSAIQAIHARVDGNAQHVIRPLVPLIAALVSVVVKEGLFRVTRAVGQRTGDRSLVANAWHHRSDTFTSIAAAAGLTGVLIGGVDWWFLDPLTAIVLSAFLVTMAIRIMKDAAAELIDQAPAARKMARIEEAVRGTPGVRTHHGVRARQVGGKVEMDVHVQVGAEMSVREGHDIASDVRRRIVEADPSVAEVIVHVEPAE